MSYPYYQPDQQTTIPTPPPPQNWASAPPYGDPQLQSFNQSQPPYYPPDQLIPNQPSFSYPTAPAYSTYESENLPNYGNQNSQKPVYENQNYSKPITEIPGYSKPITEIPGYSKPINEFPNYGIPSLESQNYGKPPLETQIYGKPSYENQNPKVESQDLSNGVQKFRVKILPDYGNQNSLDVLCQVGLDGIRMLDPNTNRTLRIYPLENVTKWEVTDPSIYTFWSKSSVDIEPRRIRLQSNRYTTSTILDTVAAACVQIREMADDRNTRFTENNKASDQQGEKKKGSIADWVTLKKPTEEKEHWVPDEAVTKCTSCGTDFGAFVRRHHCRNCGDIFCDKCTQGRTALTGEKDAQPVRVCDRCLAEVTHRLANAKDVSSKAAAPQRSHEDLAKRLMEVLGKNSKGASESGSTSLSSLLSSQSNFDSSGKRTKEVACPTCTVHLQVQVPSSGTETVECGVCQQPFLVSAR